MSRLLTAIALTVAVSCVAAGVAPQSMAGRSNDPKTTSAYGVLVLRKAAVEAELTDLSSRFTDGSPVVRTRRFELSVIRHEMEGMQRIGRDGVAKLSSTYGNLILNRVALEVELNELLERFTPEHPVVKKKRVELAALLERR
jgi:uncharacterized protein involved in exopolysaccharide biosynthesis